MQEYWSGLPFPSPGDLPRPGIKPSSPLQAESLPSVATRKELGMETYPLGGGVPHEGGEVSKHQKTLSPEGL